MQDIMLYGSLGLILSTILWIIYATINALVNRKKISHIPGSWQYFFSFFKIPFFAPYMYFGGDETLLKFIKERGDPQTKIASLSLASGNVVFLSDAKMIKELLITKESSFIKNPPTYDMLRIFGENILTVVESKDVWKKHHTICSPAFSSSSLQDLPKVAFVALEKLCKSRWENQLQKKESFVLDPTDFSDLTMHVLGLTIFGLDFGLFEDNLKGAEFRSNLEIVFTKGLILNRFIGKSPYLKWVYPFIKQVTGVESASNYVSSQLDEMINKRRDELNNEERDFGVDFKDLLSRMVESGGDLGSGMDISTQDVKSNAFIFSIAGHETTSTLLQWTVYEISKRPQIQLKMAHEANMILGKSEDYVPSIQDYENLVYVNSVIMETLRIHTPITGVGKQTRKNIQLGDYSIPQGTVVVVSISGACMNESSFEDPDRFNPDRFSSLEIQQKHQHSFSWIPFMIGNRKCIGYKFALIEACIVVAKMVKDYEFKLINDESSESDRVFRIPGGTVRPGNLKVQVSKRAQ